MVARSSSLGSCVFVVEADDIFDSFDICVFELAEVLVHQIVAFHLVDGKFRDFFFTVLPMKWAIRSSAQGISTGMISAPALLISFKTFSATLLCCFGTSSQKRFMGRPNLAPYNALLVVKLSGYGVESTSCIRYTSSICLMPTIPLTMAGQITEVSVSVPNASGTMLLETDTAEPELDPCGLLLSIYGFLV
ncbi:hypothetical protein KCV00_g378, partial [Aureobasidium melanogenum]